MRRLVLLIGLCAIPFAPLADGAGAHDRKPQGSVWVVNRDKGEVTVFDVSSRPSLARPIPTGAGAHEVALSTPSRRCLRDERARGHSSRSSRPARSCSARSRSAPARITWSPRATGGRCSSGCSARRASEPSTPATDQVRSPTGSSDNPAARAHSAYRARGSELYLRSARDPDEVTGRRRDRRDRVQRPSDPAGERGAAGPPGAPALRVRTRRGQGQGDRSRHPRARRRGGGRPPARDAVADARPANARRLAARNAGAARVRRHLQPDGGRDRRDRRRGHVRRPRGDVATTAGSCSRRSIAAPAAPAASRSSTSGAAPSCGPGTTRAPGGRTESRTRPRGRGSAAGGRAARPPSRPRGVGG